MDDPDFQEAVGQAEAAGLLPPRTLLAQVDDQTACQALDWLPGDVVMLDADVPAPYVLQESRRRPDRRLRLVDQQEAERATPWLSRDRKGRWTWTEHAPIELRPVLVEVGPWDCLPTFTVIGDGPEDRAWGVLLRGGREQEDVRVLGALLALLLRVGVLMLEGDLWGVAPIREGEAWARLGRGRDPACWIGATYEIVSARSAEG